MIHKCDNIRMRIAFHNSNLNKEFLKNLVQLLRTATKQFDGFDRNIPGAVYRLKDLSIAALTDATADRISACLHYLVQTVALEKVGEILFRYFAHRQFVTIVERPIVALEAGIVLSGLVDLLN